MPCLIPPGSSLRLVTARPFEFWEERKLLSCSMRICDLGTPAEISLLTAWFKASSLDPNVLIFFLCPLNADCFSFLSYTSLIIFVGTVMFWAWSSIIPWSKLSRSYSNKTFLISDWEKTVPESKVWGSGITEPDSNKFFELLESIDEELCLGLEPGALKFFEFDESDSWVFEEICCPGWSKFFEAKFGTNPILA